MTKFALSVVVSTLVALLPSIPVRAASGNGSEVTFVSGTGNDANTSSYCPRASPCQSIRAAISVTLNGGTVFCTDPGVSVGPITISSDVTIDCSQGSQAAIPNLSGSDDIDINAVGVNVILRGLTIYGIDSPLGAQPVGIHITSAASVRIENCKIFNFVGGSGILVAPSSGNVSVKIQDSTITRNIAGVKVAPSGNATVQIAIDRSRVEHNSGGGVRVDASNGGPITATISDSSISLNGANGVVGISSPSGSVLVNLTNDIIASNALAGVEASQSAGGSATVTVSRTTLSNNGNAWNSVASGTLLSFKNNEVTGPIGTSPSSASFQ